MGKGDRGATIWRKKRERKKAARVKRKAEARGKARKGQA